MFKPWAASTFFINLRYVVYEMGKTRSPATVFDNRYRRSPTRVSSLKTTLCGRLALVPCLTPKATKATSPNLSDLCSANDMSSLRIPKSSDGLKANAL